MTEWDYGELEGLTRPQIQDRYPGWSVWDGPWPGGETADDVAARADRVIDVLLGSGATRVAVVGHGHFSRVLAARWLGQDLSVAGQLLLDTATWSDLGWFRGLRVLRHWNVAARTTSRRRRQRPRDRPTTPRGGRQGWPRQRRSVLVSQDGTVQPEPPTPPTPPAPACYIHPDRTAGSVCRRCNRPICPDCMREAPVGWQCARCVHQDSKRAPVTRWRPTNRGRLGNTRLTPVVLTLIVINVAVYIWEMASHAGVYVYRGVAYPCANLTECRYALWPTAVHQGQWYRLFTAAFLHANFEHILFNMIALAIVGPPVEAELGKADSSSLYLLSAVGGSVARTCCPGRTCWALEHPGRSSGSWALISCWPAAATGRSAPSWP